jgi:heme/copper-type cytochrome/quinol oxidase subunit 4
VRSPRARGWWPRRTESRALAAILALALAVRLPLLPLDGPHGDLAAFTFYGAHVLVAGPHALYDPSTIPEAMWIIPPVFPFITGATFWAWRALAILAGVAPPAGAGVMPGAPPFGEAGFLVKLWIVAGDFGLAATAYAWVKRWAGERWAVATVAALLLNPALVYESAWWGQIESLLTLALALALVCAARGQIAAGWSWWTVMVLTKPQAVVELPLLLALTLRRDGPRRLARGLAAGAATFVVVTAPFWLTGRLDKVVGNYANVTSVDHRVSVNAYNLWWAISGPGGWHNWATDTDAFVAGLTYRHAGMALCLAYAILILWVYRPGWLWRSVDLTPPGPGPLPSGHSPASPYRRGETHGPSLGLEREHVENRLASTVLGAGACLYLAFFLMATLIHERYLYPAVVLLAFSIWRHPLIAVLYGVFSATLWINLAHTAPAVPWMASGLERLGVTPWRTAVVNMVAFAVLTGVVLAWQHGWTLQQRRPALRRLASLALGAAALALALAAVGAQLAPPGAAGSRTGEVLAFTLGTLLVACAATALVLLAGVRWATVRPYAQGI